MGCKCHSLFYPLNAAFPFSVSQGFDFANCPCKIALLRATVRPERQSFPQRHFRVALLAPCLRLNSRDHRDGFEKSAEAWSLKCDGVEPTIASGLAAVSERETSQGLSHIRYAVRWGESAMLDVLAM